MKIPLIILCAMVFVSGCASLHSDDPHELGLFDGIYGITQGTYQARLDARMDHLAKLEIIKQKLNGQIAITESTTDYLQAKKEEMWKRQSELSAEIVGLEKDISAMEDSIKKAGKEEEELNSKIEKMQEGLKSVGKNVNQWNVSLKQAEEQVKGLRQEVEAMIALQTE